VCGYEVRDGLLYLRELWVNHQPGDVPITRRQLPPHLNGVRAGRDEKSFFGEWHFCDVGLPLAYTGGLLVGLYVHMGLHPAWKYEHVHELLFDHGRLIETRDVSPEMAQLRTRMQNGFKPGPAATREQIAEWVAGCFRRNYR
jgi:hypothetical protein